MTTIRRSYPVLSTITVVASLLAACSGSSDGGSAAAEIAACPLLSSAELETVVGTPMGEGMEREPVGGGENAGRMTACAWEAVSDAPGAAIVTLQVWAWPPGSGGAANYLNSFREAAKTSKDLPTPEPVTLGDEAIWDGTGTIVRSGDVSFSVALSEKGLDPAVAKARSQKLAADVLAKL